MHLWSRVNSSEKFTLAAAQQWHLGLEMIFGVPPLELKIRQVARSTFVRISEDFANFRFKPKGKGKRGHLQWCAESISNTDIPLHLKDSEKAHLAEKNKYTIDTKSFNTGSDEDHDSHDVTVYTDGSRMGAKPELQGQPEDGGSAGSGVFIEAGKGKDGAICAAYHEGLGSVTTVFQSEVYAITCATNYLLEKLPEIQELSSRVRPDVFITTCVEGLCVDCVFVLFC